MKLFYGMIIALSAFFPAGCGNSGGADSLVYHIDLPAGVRAFLALYPIDAPGTSHEINLSPDAGKTASGSLPALAPGSYLTVIDLYDAAGNRAPAPVEEVVSVSSGLPLTLSRGFTASGFSGCDPLAGQGASTLAAKLDAALASAPGKYTVLVDGTETDLASFAPKTLHGKGNRTITLRGGGHQVQAGAAGTPLFTIEAGSGSTLTLVLRDIALKGRDGNTVPVIRVNAGGKLAMKTGALISGNTSVDDGNVRIYADSPMSPMNPGGGVVLHDGTLEMSGGVISGNTAHDGGGGVVLYDGIFAMSGGAIRGNTAYGDGGGVIVYAGTLEMSGGAISGNTASHGGGGVLVVDGGVMNIRGGAISGNTASRGGGGVTVFDGIFGMSGGTISGNTGETGGGVLIVDNGTFQMSGGAISGNTAHDSGGGVVLYDGIFAMNGGAISGNTAARRGGGALMAMNAAFTVSGGEISGNAASYDGGGMYVDIGGIFQISGGGISGNTAARRGGGVFVSQGGTLKMSGGAIHSNTGEDGGGGVFVYSGKNIAIHRRESFDTAAFTMSGGTISGNTGGGVFAGTGGIFAMSGGTVGNNILSGASACGREVYAGPGGTFKMSASALPERIFLDSKDQSVTIAGPLSAGITFIDLGLTRGAPLTDYINAPVLSLDISYSAGDLAGLKSRFSLGNSKLKDPPYQETPITGYTISAGGRFVAE